MEHQIREIFERITEHYDVPIHIGSRCETNTYYRIEDLTSDDIELCARYLADRVNKVCQPNLPQALIILPGSFTDLIQELAKELGAADEPLPVIELAVINSGNGKGNPVKDKKVMLINDVITTARSCLEAHTQVTMRGASVLCWGALIDRTFGPGPVPVISAHTGEPVLLLEDIP